MPLTLKCTDQNAPSKVSADQERISKTISSIPGGLKPLLKDISREVLRRQPENIYEFIADCIESKLNMRDGKVIQTLFTPDGQNHRRGSWDWLIWSWQGSSRLTEEELLDFLNDVHVDFNVAQHAALLIQAAYRGFRGRRRYANIKHERERLREVWNEWLQPGHLDITGSDAEYILAHYGLTLEEANVFATKIQAVIRGFHQRYVLAHKDPELADHLKDAGVSHDAQAHHHATKIQSLFRGYKARKALKEKKLKLQERRLTILLAHTHNPVPEPAETKISRRTMSQAKSHHTSHAHH